MPRQPAPTGTRSFFFPDQVLAAPPRPFPSCYPMARGATLAEMYEISCGKNMHADPHLVSPIMEV